MISPTSHCSSPTPFYPDNLADLADEIGGLLGTNTHHVVGYWCLHPSLCAPDMAGIKPYPGNIRTFLSYLFGGLYRDLNI